MNDENQGQNARIRAGLYIDGFNLYHAIHDLGEPFLKWADYWRLGEIITPSRTEKLVKVCYCTAFYPDERKKWRHEQLIGALKVKGVSVERGHYVHEDMKCNACDTEWKKPTEKAGDINVAIHLLRDAFRNQIDHAYLLSQDSDQSATAKLFAREFPDKMLTTVAPPGRNFSAHIEKYTEGRRIKLSKTHIERCVMPPVVFAPGVFNARRPREYEPPADWVHPDNRPN